LASSRQETNTEDPFKGSPRAVLLSLHALKFAHRSGRISDIEKTKLKNTLLNNSTIDSIIFEKVFFDISYCFCCVFKYSQLSVSEQTAYVLAFPLPNDSVSMESLMQLAELKDSERFELDTLRRQLHRVSFGVEDVSTTIEVSVPLTTYSCHICGDDGLSQANGINCSHTVETARHFLCDSCMTSYVRSLNDDPTDSLFHQRQGRILCPSSSLISHLLILSSF